MMKKRSLTSILLGCASVLTACASGDQLDDAPNASDSDELASVAQALTTPLADRATYITNSTSPAFLPPVSQDPPPSGLCFESIPGSGNARERLASCTFADNQYWTFEPTTQSSPLPWGQLVNVRQQYCLSLASSLPKHGDPTFLAPCTGSVTQRWLHTTSGTFRSAANYDLCLDADAPTGTIGVGTRIHLWDCHGGGNERWKFGSTWLRSPASGRCLDGNGPNGSVRIWDCSWSSHQHWQQRFGKEVVLDLNGKCLRTTGLQNGAPVVLGPCDGAAITAFALRADGRIWNRASNRCLDVIDEGTANGTGLQIWDCVGGLNQRWNTR
jgi:hypothetical protein